MGTVRYVQVTLGLAPAHAPVLAVLRARGAAAPREVAWRRWALGEAVSMIVREVLASGHGFEEEGSSGASMSMSLSLPFEERGRAYLSYLERDV